MEDIKKIYQVVTNLSLTIDEGDIMGALDNLYENIQYDTPDIDSLPNESKIDLMLTFLKEMTCNVEKYIKNYC